MAMMNALGSAVSGLKSQQTALDVIANNISNVSTTGYKAQTVSFSDLLSQTLQAASSPTTTTGGTNPVQEGLGVSVSSIGTDMTVGTASSSSDSLDVALSGEGFLIVEGGSEGEYQFTRDGDLSVDSEGNLNMSGYQVCGWESSYTLDSDGNKVFSTTGTVEPINIYSGNNKYMAASASTSADFSGSLDSGDTVATGATALNNIGDATSLTFDTTSEITAYDAQGNAYDVNINWKKCASENGVTSWYWEADTTDSATISPSSGYVAFDSDGKMVTSVTTLSASVDDTAGYTSSNISVGSGVTAGDYTVTVTGTKGDYTVTLSDGTNTYTNTSTATDGSATFSVGTGTITLSVPTSISTGTSAFTVSGTTATGSDANYNYSDVSIGSDVTAGNYTVTVTGTSGNYTVSLSDGTNTYTNTSTATDGSATFTVGSGTITLAVPKNLEAGTTTFTVASSTKTFDSSPSIVVTPAATVGTDAVTVKLDFSDLTTSNMSTTSSSDASDVTGTADGNVSGTLQSETISSDGIITGTYSNGKTQAIAQIALAVFSNPEGLTKLGDNLYAESNNSGNYNVVVAGTGGSGTMQSSALELSNVDLASQFSQMMVSQRAYQANSKVITTSDSMLESLINMIR